MSHNHIEESDQNRGDIPAHWIRRSAVSLFASKVVASAAVLFAGVLLLDYLDPADYGFYQVVISLSSLTVLMFGFGFSPVVARFIPDLLERGNSRTAARFLLVVLAVRIGLMAVLIPLGFLFFHSIEGLFGLEELDKIGPLLIFAIVLGVYLGSSAGPVVLGAYGRQAEIGLGAGVSSFLRIVAIVFVVTQDYGLIGILIAISTIEIVMLLIYAVRVFIVVKSQTLPVDQSHSQFLAKRAFRYSAPHSIISALSFFEGRFGMIFVITNTVGTAGVGNYAFVFVMLQFGAIINPVYTLNSLIDNVIVRHSVHVDRRVLLVRGQRMFLALSAYTAVPVAVYLLLIREPLSQAFGFEHAGTGWLFFWAGIFFISNSLKLAYGNIFSQLEVPQYKLISGIIGLIGVGVAFGVIVPYGIVGVAAVAAISSSVVLLLQHLISLRLLDIPVGIYPVMWFKIVAINALAGVATSTVIFISDRFVLIALSTSIVFVAVYVLISFVLRPFDREDMTLFRSIIPNISIPKIRPASK